MMQVTGAPTRSVRAYGGRLRAILITSAAALPMMVHAQTVTGSLTQLGATPKTAAATTVYATEGGTATGVSADGTVAVGKGITDYSPTKGTTELAYRWTPTGGITVLGTVAGDDNSAATGVSGDGTVVVGDSYNLAAAVATPANGVRYNAFRWTQAGGMQALGRLAGDASNQARGASYDGAVVVGSSSNSTAFHLEAFRWTAAAGSVGLGYFAAGAHGAAVGNASEALGVSADGGVVVGRGYYNAGFQRAFRWTAAGGMADIGTIGDGNNIFSNSRATQVSGDGNVVVGDASSLQSPYQQLFRWTAATGVVGFGDLGASVFSVNGKASAYATGISYDGNVIVYNLNLGAGSLGKEAYRWQKDTAGTVAGGTPLLIQDWLATANVSTVG